MVSRKIAVGVDFSAESELAAHQALDVARHIHGELILVHAIAVVDIPVVPRSSPPATAQVIEIYRSQLEHSTRRDRERLADLRMRLSDQGVPVSQLLVEGLADDGLVEAAHKAGAELIVVGTHGRTGLRWFHLGSVAHRVVRMSDGDVLVARGEGAARGGYQRILVAADFSPSSGQALDRAVWLAAPGAHIDVVHFYQGASRAEPYEAIRAALAAADLNRTIVSELAMRGERFIAERARAGLAIRFHAIGDGPLPGILHYLERYRFDLASVGSHGRRGFHRFAVGSVAEAVVQRAPCSVLIARAGAGPEER
ncbi:MAG TPA: universal stress protein [Kofleriaceae bacterium]|nr:universal stress protein [Kofleriaceae bacterium]